MIIELLYIFIFTVIITLGVYAADFLARFTPAWLRKRKVNRRIIKQAKAAGAWGDPEKLGGRALELYARKVWGIYREQSETDAALRLRIYSKRKGQF